MKYLQVDIEVRAEELEPVVGVLLMNDIVETVVEDPLDLERLLNKDASLVVLFKDGNIKEYYNKRVIDIVSILKENETALIEYDIIRKPEWTAQVF